MIPPSPSRLSPPVVRRLNRVPIAIGCFAAATVIGAVGYTAYTKTQSHPAADVTEPETKKTQGGKTPNFLNAGAASEPPAAKPQPDPVPIMPTAAPRATESGLTFDEQARAQAWQVYYQAQAQAVAAHMALEQSAHSGLTDPLQGNGGSPAQIPGMDQAGGPLVAPGTPGAPYSVGGVNPEGQTGKQAFLRTPGDVWGADEDLKGGVHGPKPSTILEGTAIPIRLIEGATSDMPGQINAEVLQNVYDTMTGDLLLIPQGSHVVGAYDIAVSAGQERLGIIWNRIIMPDTSSRQIGSMSGADQAGLGGMADQVDTHFWKKFGSALMVSLIGAGAQLSQPQQSAFATPSSTSAAAGAMTQQLSQFGIRQADQNQSIPNTINLRPGLMGVIKVNKDMLLPVYHDARLQNANNTTPVTLGRFIQ